ncbi:MAG: alpha/beta fold hydrolase [Polyangiales bacterium]
MKRRTRIASIVVAALVLLSLLLVRCDVPRERLMAKYAPEPSKFVDIEGMRVHYRDQGTGAPLVLIHGTSSSLHTWEGWVSRLSTHRRVVRLDLPGFGLTGPTPDGDYTAARLARVVATLMDRLAIAKADVAGNSLGGRVALTFALEHPDRVRKLVLVDAAGLSGQKPPKIFAFARTPVLGRLLTVVTPRAIVRKNLVEVYGDPTRIDEALVDRYFDFTLAEGNRRALYDRLNGPRDPDLDARIPEIHAPTLLLWGERDRWIPLEFAKRFQSSIAGAKLVSYPDAGHVPMEELAELTARDADAFLGD